MADELDVEAFEFDASQGKEGDPAEAQGREELRKFFDQENEAVFFCRQIEILFEGRFFHWITARALRNLVEAGRVRMEVRRIPSTGGVIHLFWNRKYRYYRRAADEVVRWTRTNHDLDFIFERNQVAYGVEVKNTLGYPEHSEIFIKLTMT